MISKSKISKRISKKTDPEVVETIIFAKKNKFWVKVAQRLSASRKKYDTLNLHEINSGEFSDGDIVAIPGKVLGAGNLTKKIRISALRFSKSAEEKLKKSKIKTSFLVDEIKNNPKGEGVKLIWKKG